MSNHASLTGIDLHESKGVSTATVGQVYAADGLGSGSWVSKNGDIFNANNYTLQGDMQDIGAAANSVFFYIHKKSQMSKLAVVNYAVLTGANAILSIYINGVLFTDSLTVPFSGSAVGGGVIGSIVTANTLSPGAVVEIRSDGGPTNAGVARATISLLLLNIL